MFVPALFRSLKDYSRAQFGKDLLAGVIVGIVAFPLAIAFAIASGVSPEKGIYTAVVAGFVIAAFGGSKVQIGGPTGAFIILVYSVVQSQGVAGLMIATFIAGILLMALGFSRLGGVIKYIPHSLITGFTSGIAVIIFSSQVKDLLGLRMGAVPVDFVEKWREYFLHLSGVNWYALGIALFTVLTIIYLPRFTRRVPGPLAAILLATLIVQYFGLPVETIGSRYGSIAVALPSFSWPEADWATIKRAMQPGIAIALLGGIESLLSAVVADGMTGGKHNSNMELVAQGGANIASSLTGGIPATGAIARTAVNIRSGGRTPVAGITHSAVLLVMLLVVGKWATLIPMSCLAGILAVVAYNMAEMEAFRNIVRSGGGDVAVLLVTFFLTVIFDITVAIEGGMVLAAFMFIRKMARSSYVKNMLPEGNGDGSGAQPVLPQGVEVFELNGPLFFGAAYKFRDAIALTGRTPRVLILKMRNVPMIDVTGLQVVNDLLRTCGRNHIRLIVAGLQPGVREEFRKSRLLFRIGKRYVAPDLQAAVRIASEVSKQKEDNG